jgi:murein DD-endopeptidase MepM/ murein hydrolase activator NlpD
MKFIMLMAISTILVLVLVTLFYKPIYRVTIDSETVGYSKDKSQLQAKINEYIENGNEEDNVAFVQVDNLPEYKLCLLKRNIVTNDDEIFDEIKQQGTTYYKYFAILEGDEEKSYVSEFSTAEEVVASLKEKESTNIDSISIVEKYESELTEFDTAEVAVEKLFVEPVVEQPVVVAKTTSKVKASGSVNTSLTTSGQNVSLGISLARPISGTITSRFGAKSSIRSSAHTGLDIAATTGTPIGAAAAGTVTFAGYKGSYGNMIVITHSNGVQTYYGHCSKLYASVGDTVSQGETIAAVGSTGNSTGPHLHLEVRVDGVAYNPQNYVY